MRQKQTSSNEYRTRGSSPLFVDGIRLASTRYRIFKVMVEEQDRLVTLGIMGLAMLKMSRMTVGERWNVAEDGLIAIEREGILKGWMDSKPPKSEYQMAKLRKAI